MPETTQVLAADIVRLKRRSAREQGLFEISLEVLRQGFRMRMPEALKKAEAMRARLLQKAVNSEKQIELIKARAGQYLRRAERIDEILETNRNRNLIRARHGATPEALATPPYRPPRWLYVSHTTL